MKTIAYVSSVSGLPNLLGIERRVKGMFARLSRGTIKKITVVAIDLDHFKPINDQYGHKNGDKVLKVAGEILLHCTRPEDIIGHLSGDEYVVLFADTEQDEVDMILARANDMFSVHQFSFAEGDKVDTRFTYGLAESNGGRNVEYEKLYFAADLDCNRRKEMEGGSRHKSSR